MNTVIRLWGHREQPIALPTLVMIDLHHPIPGFSGRTMQPEQTEALKNCRAILKHARESGFAVGFTREIARRPTMAEKPVYPRWLEGFEPQRCDMVFERERPSCYTSREFSEMVQHLGGSYVIAGQVGELSCLSTIIDAFHRDHRVTVLTDALVSYDCESAAGGTMSSAVARILSYYANATSTEEWIQSSRRKVWMAK